MNAFFDRIHDLLARDEAELAVDQLALFLKGGRRSAAYREVLLQAARLSRLRRQERQGLMDSRDVSRERARIEYALLELVDELARATTPAERPFVTPDVDLEPPAKADLEKIIGAKNLKAIAWLARGLEVAKSVCRIVTPRGLGTGFLVDEDRMVTNHHVLSDPQLAGRSYAEFNFQEDGAGELEEHFRYGLRPEGFKSDVELDFSLVRISGDPSLPPLSFWGSLPLEAGAAPEVGEHVSIVQHPGGGTKQIAITANQVVNLFGHRLQYTTDTLPGSSGSPVFNDDWQVAALHHAGGNLVVNERGDRMFANEGILVSSILEKLGQM